MAVAMDLGNPNSTFGSIHPTDKKDVGSRLAIAGLSVAYDVNLYYTGPLIDAVREHTQSFPFILEAIFKSVDVQIEVRNADGFEVCIYMSTVNDVVLPTVNNVVLQLWTILCCQL